MALDFGILQPANISGQLQAGQESAMRNQLAQQQLASGRTEQEMSQMKLSELKRNTAALESMQRKFLENGKSDDMDANYDAMISSGIPHFMDIGIKAKQTLAQTRIDYATMGLPMPSYLQPKGQAAAAGAPALNVVPRNEGVPQPVPAASEDRLGDFISQIEAKQNAPMPMPAVTGRPIQPDQALNVVSRSEGSPSPIPTANMLAPAAAPATNMLAPPPAAPANALAAPGMSAEEQRARTMLLSSNPGVRAAGQTELNRLTATSDEIRTMKALGLPSTIEGYKEYKTLSQSQPDFEKLLAMSNLSPAEKDSLRIKRLQKEATHAPGTSVYLPPQEKAFEGELGKGQAEGVIKSRAAAQDAAAIIDTVKTGRDIMKSGMITGAGADFLVNLNQGLKTAGIDAGYADASANSQAFAANMAGNVGKLIKQFGAGTGLSDADREFAKEMAGGRISLDAKAINRILEINEKAARNTITRHNKDVKGIKTNIPLEVEMPPEFKTPVVGAPSAAIEYLRANPAMKGAFDAKYGAGAADRALKGQ